MKRIRHWFRGVGRRLAGMSLRTRLAAGMLAVLVAAGAAWLAGGTGEPAMTAVLDEPLEKAAIIEARSLLDAKNIPTRTEDGMLLAAPQHRDQARSILTDRDLLVERPARSFTQLLSEDNIWASLDHTAKRWQAGKMEALERIISDFPTVRKARVLFEQGTPRSLGAAASKPTAAVAVKLKTGERMNIELVAAIADLVAGSITSMQPGEVSIIDTASGMSFRVTDATAADIAALRLRQEAEAYYGAKIRSAVSYIDGVVVDVRAAGADAGRGAPESLSVRISIPRSYLDSVAARSDALVPEPGAQISEDLFENIGDLQLSAGVIGAIEKVRRAALKSAGIINPSAVEMCWHYDVKPTITAKAASSTPMPAQSRHDGISLAAAGAGVVCWAALMSALLAVRRLKRYSGDADNGAPAESQQGRAVQFAEAHDPRMAIQAATARDVARALRDEQPQTIAVMLSRLSPDKAAEVLRSLPGDTQVAASRLIARLDRIDREAAEEIERVIAARLGESGGEVDSHINGVSQLAKILDHAGAATERRVVKGLSGSDPGLVESLRAPILAFEDIVAVPAERLRATLAAVDVEELAVALRTAGGEVAEKVFACIPAQAGERLREEMARIGPVRLSDVEIAQKIVLEAITDVELGEYLVAGESERSELLA